MIRLGLFDPDPESDEVRWIGKPAIDTPRHRRDFEQVIERYYLTAPSDVVLCLGIFRVSGSAAHGSRARARQAGPR
jgi:hypothetical protein